MRRPKGGPSRRPAAGPDSEYSVPDTRYQVPRPAERRAVDIAGDVGGRRWCFRGSRRRRARKPSTRNSLRRAGVGAGLRGPECRQPPRRWWIALYLPPTIPCYVPQWLPWQMAMSTDICQFMGALQQIVAQTAENAKERPTGEPAAALCWIRRSGVAFLDDVLKSPQIDLHSRTHR